MRALFAHALNTPTLCSDSATLEATPLSEMPRYFTSHCTNLADCELRLLRDPAIRKYLSAPFSLCYISYVFILPVNPRDPNSLKTTFYEDLLRELTNMSHQECERVHALNVDEGERLKHAAACNKRVSTLFPQQHKAFMNGISYKSKNEKIVKSILNLVMRRFKDLPFFYGNEPHTVDFAAAMSQKFDPWLSAPADAKPIDKGPARVLWLNGAFPADLINAVHLYCTLQGKFCLFFSLSIL